MAKFDDIAKIVEVKYLKDQRSLTGILQEEQKLRGLIEKIRSQSESVSSQEISTLASIGGDVLWNAWVERSLTQLNTELAHVLARKEMHLSQVRRSFNQLHVTQKIVDTENLTNDKARKRKSLERIIECDLSSIKLERRQ